MTLVPVLMTLVLVALALVALALVASGLQTLPWGALPEWLARSAHGRCARIQQPGGAERRSSRGHESFPARDL